MNRSEAIVRLEDIQEDLLVFRRELMDLYEKHMDIDDVLQTLLDELGEGLEEDGGHENPL